MLNSGNKNNNSIIKWARHLYSISCNGMIYSENEFDRERYLKIRDISAEMFAGVSDYTSSKVKDLFNTEIGYNTPKIESRGVISKNNSILFVKEKEDGNWSLPGGMVDQNETPGQSVEREVQEETGYFVKAEKLLAIMDRDSHSHYPPHPFSVFKLFIRCKIIGGSQKKSLETDDARYFKESDIPNLSVSRVTIYQVKRMFEHCKNSDLPTDFD
jgi:ADP-ribose pyrophosphatase YjhB (NUDIX family)